MIDTKRMWAVWVIITVIGVPGIALAVPKGPGGQTCKSSGTTTVKGKDEATGQAMNCTADYCKYDECETSGPKYREVFRKDALL